MVSAVLMLLHSVFKMQTLSRGMRGKPTIAITNGFLETPTTT